MRISTKDIGPALTGESLTKSLEEETIRRTAIAESFLYEQTILMLAADPGCGKSTISTQAAVELAAGLPLFGVFSVPKPVQVLYIQAERSIIEFLERLKVISKSLPLVTENLFITDEYQKFNLLNPDHGELFIECIKRDCPNARIIIFDPIYSLVAGGLKEDVPASAFTKVMSRVQKETGSALWYNHHTVKTQYGSDGKVVDREDPFYGSQWLKAHCTGSYYMRKSDTGVTLINKKDNYNILAKSVQLDYNPETELCVVPTSELLAADKLKLFLRARVMDKKEFTFKEIQTQTGICTRTLRELLVHSSFKASLNVVSASKNRHIYTVAAPL